MICHRRTIIVRTDEPYENQFFKDISIYISNNNDILILERIHEENNQVNTKPIELSIPTPQSTFNIIEITNEIRNTEEVLSFQYVYHCIFSFAI